MNITENIKRILDEKGITQRELAERLGIHHVSLGTMLRKGNFRIETLEKFASAIGCDVADFFSRPKFICPHCGKELQVTIQ